MGDQAALSSLGFAPILEIKQTDGFWKKVFYDTLNWMHTNKKGMTFSFLAGAFFLSILPLFRRRKFKSGLGNSTIGLIMGTPLGVCVNCAAPIARSLHASGVAVQTSLSALVASPTLNVVVVFMAFAMFPFYLVTLKLVLTLTFIMVLVPLGCHFFFKEEVEKQQVQEVCEVNLVNNNTITEKHQNWFGAIFWCMKTYAKNFLYLLKIALPLMLLSGFLGALLTTSLDWSAIEQLDNNVTTAGMFGILFMLSVFGALLPSPMAFDIVISAALLEAGVPIHFVAAFLVTLGSFSIYAFFIVWQSMSLRVAAYMMVCTISMGLAAGLIAPHFERANIEKSLQALDTGANPAAAISPINQAQIGDIPADEIPSAQNKYDPIITRRDPVYSFDQLKPLLEKQTITPTQVSGQNLPETISIAEMPLNAATRAAQTKMDFIPGDDIGLTQPYTISYITGIPEAVAQSGMAISSGDVHNDGWPDILISSDPEHRPSLALFTNIGGEKFMRQYLPIPKDIPQVTVAALVDLNADQWLDIVFASFKGENYVLYNDQGNFKAENLKILSPHKDGTTISMSFGDVEGDGDLDILLGNWNVGPLFVNYVESRNILLLQNEQGTFDEIAMPGATGETLTSIMLDFNNDKNLDIYTGNDFIFNQYSDLLKLGKGDGTFKIAGASTVTDIVGTQSTMSIDVGDVNNDLKPDFYIGQIAYNGHHVHKMSEIADRNIAHLDFCTTTVGKTIPNCEEDAELKLALARATHNISDACSGIENPVNKQKCLHHTADFRNACNILELEQPPPLDSFKTSARYRDFCLHMYDAYDRGDKMEEYYLHLPAKTNSLDNVLLVNKSTDAQPANYKDEANARKVGFGAWTWNARFGDLDNDGWEDLYLVNGYPFTQAVATNLFYRNTGDGNFEDKTREFGLENHTNTTAFTFVDMDNDGDLDIVNAPTDAPTQAYRTQASGRSVQIALKDETTKNTGAIGAVITLTLDENGTQKKVMRVMKGSGGHKSYNQPIAHFGTADGARITNIQIDWPDGQTQSMPVNLEDQTRYVITRKIK